MEKLLKFTLSQHLSRYEFFIRCFQLNMVEIMEIQHRTEGDSCLVRGIVHDYDVHHPSMPKALTKCFYI